MKLLIGKDGKEIFVDEKKLGKDIHTHFGVIKKDDILKAKSGSTIKSHNKHIFKVVEASMPDFFANLKRGPAIILLKDAGVIVAKTGIGPGSRVVEAGSGSGAFTTFLANLVRPYGKVYSYELREDFLNIAKSNIEAIGLSEHVEFTNKDISKGIKEKEVDVVVLDLPEPWKCIKKVKSSLRFGGYMVCYLPTINQVLEVEKALEGSGIKILEVLDMKEEKWKLGSAARPVSFQLGHTAYLVFARKI